MTNTITQALPASEAMVEAPTAVISKDTVKDRYEIQKLEPNCFRVYDHREKEFVGNAHETEGACRQIIRTMTKKD